MRRVFVIAVFALGLAAVPSRGATAQDPTVGEGRMETPVATAVAEPADSVAKVRKPDAGPRLPAFVEAVGLPEVSAAPAPKGNIVIPVTTALIVAAVVLLILIID